MTALRAISEKTLFTGKTHTTAGPTGTARSADGFLDIKLSQPHPAAENLFGAAWSTCFLGAVQLAAAQAKVALPATPAVNAEIDLINAEGEFFLRARLDVHVPGIDRAIAHRLVDKAHEICPYSKATRGNIDVRITLL